MKLEIGSILRSFIGQNRDAEDEVELHQTQMVEDDDIQTVEQQHIPGFQYNPPVESRGFIAKAGKAWKIMLGIFDLVGRVSLNPGEIILYSSSGGTIQAKMTFKTDGSIEVVVPGGLKITGDMEQTGDYNLTGSADISIEATIGGIPYTPHLHIDSIGGTGSGPQTAAVVPTVPFATHKHSQAADSNGDTEADTGVPHN